LRVMAWAVLRGKCEARKLTLRGRVAVRSTMKDVLVGFTFLLMVMAPVILAMDIFEWKRY
jgi:hypothetical protein